jgi:hypothetical protein
LDLGIDTMTKRSLHNWSDGARLLLAAVAAAGGFACSPALAASQGSLGATSTGSITITASVPNRARITGLTDVSFLNQDPATPASSAEDVCVWSNTATKGYTITATGSGSGNIFTLSNGSGTVPYSVEWAGSSGQTSGTALAAGTASASLTSTAVDPTCSSAPAASASLIVKMVPADLGTMSAGSNYTGTLTLLVTPQ